MTTLAVRLANGPLAAHPRLGLAILLLLFGLAGAVAPEVTCLP